MSNEQFAEPEGQNLPRRNIPTDPQEQQMINVDVDPREKILPQPPKPLRSRQWLWLAIAILTLGLAASGIDELFGPFQHNSVENYSFRVIKHVNLVVHDGTGSIIVHHGEDNNQVTIQAIKYAGLFNTVPTVKYTQHGDTIVADAQDNGGFFLGNSAVDFTITLPSHADLRIHTDTGQISVQDISGTMSLTTGSGPITANDDTLSRSSVVHTATGSITFNGALVADSLCEISSDTGSVDVTLPRNAIFHLDESSVTDTFTSSFARLNAEHLNTLGSEAHGNIGTSPTATSKLHTNSGPIDLHWA